MILLLKIQRHRERGGWPPYQEYLDQRRTPSIHDQRRDPLPQPHKARLSFQDDSETASKALVPHLPSTKITAADYRERHFWQSLLHPMIQDGQKNPDIAPEIS